MSHNATKEEMTYPKHKAKITVADWHDFNQQIVQGNIISVRQWIQIHNPSGLFFNELTPNVRNPVCTAAEHGMTEIMDLLIKSGFALESLDIKQYRDGPLHLAAYKGHLDLVKKLVEIHKMDVNSRSNGFCVLQRAVVGDQCHVLQYLLGKGANPNLVHPRPIPPFTDDIELRLRCRTSVRQVVKDDLGEVDQCLLEDYLLNIALMSGHRAVAHMLLQAGARYTQAFGYCVENLCLHRAPCFYVLLFLLEIRAPILYQDPWIIDNGLRECSPLPCAARDGNLLPVTLMLRAGCEVRPDIISGKYDAFFRGHYGNEVRNVLRQWQLTTRSLQDLCIFSIRRSIKFVSPNKVRSLLLPTRLKKYIRLEHLLENHLTYTANMVN